jgi:hypothetical protein
MDALPRAEPSPRGLGGGDGAPLGGRRLLRALYEDLAGWLGPARRRQAGGAAQHADPGGLAVGGSTALARNVVASSRMPSPRLTVRGCWGGMLVPRWWETRQL